MFGVISIFVDVEVSVGASVGVCEGVFVDWMLKLDIIAEVKVSVGVLVVMGNIVATEIGVFANWVKVAKCESSVCLASAVVVALIGIVAMVLSYSLLITTPINVIIEAIRITSADGVRSIAFKDFIEYLCNQNVRFMITKCHRSREGSYPPTPRTSSRCPSWTNPGLPQGDGRADAE